MGETQKPFSCSSAGCSMTFTNEDHLTIHQKKHDMSLNLELSSKNYIEDQTPTPTRFIRTCDEVGLFQDLQNVNPFEVTFRKAVENVKITSLSIPDVNADDTLHTPQIYPPLEESRPAYSISRIPSIDENLLTSSESESLQIGTKKDVTFNLTDISPTNSLFLRRLNSKNASFDCEDDPIETDNIKQKIKNNLLKNIKGDKTVVIPEINVLSPLDDCSSIIVGPTVSVLQRKRAGSPQNSSEINQKKVVNESVCNLENKRAINRAAQSRSRQRKKHWLDKMGKTMDELKTANKSLYMENASLKSQIEILKRIVLSHEECIKEKDPSIGEQLVMLSNPSSTFIKQTASVTTVRDKFVPIIPQIPKPAPTNNIVTIIPTVLTGKPAQLTNITPVIPINVVPMTISTTSNNSLGPISFFQSSKISTANTRSINIMKSVESSTKRLHITRKK